MSYTESQKEQEISNTDSKYQLDLPLVCLRQLRDFVSKLPKDSYWYSEGIEIIVAWERKLHTSAWWINEDANMPPLEKNLAMCQHLYVPLVKEINAAWVLIEEVNENEEIQAYIKESRGLKDE